MMFGLFKKKKKEYKRPSYYPTMRIKYVKEIDKNNVDCNIESINFCCDSMKSCFTESYAPNNHIKPVEFYSPIFVMFNQNNFNLNPKDHCRLRIYSDSHPYIEEDRWLKTGIGNKKSPLIHYCPFCGAKIEMECIKTYEKVKVGCDEVVEPEKIIPAKTRKVCKYEWQEVK